ncbi:MAG TPA: ComF family protein [Gammaproteobacteria bacterium]|nr:ComF family protein [Gammaproteobacteria bacterium]
MVYGWLAKASRRLYPPYCLLCSQPSRSARELCNDCARDLPWNRHACPRCALPLPAESGPQLCGQCLKSPPVWDSAEAPLLYDWPLDQLLQRFKFQGDLATGQLLGESLAEFLAASSAARPEVLIPVPLHSARLRERGFNQAWELARPVSRRLHLRLDNRACLRRKNTAVQSKLDARERRRNLRDAFEVRTSLQGVHVGILDDVVTTGATVAAISRALRDAGAARITVWSLARAARPA